MKITRKEAKYKLERDNIITYIHHNAFKVMTSIMMHLQKVWQVIHNGIAEGH